MSPIENISPHHLPHLKGSNLEKYTMVQGNYYIFFITIINIVFIMRTFNRLILKYSNCIESTT